MRALELECEVPSRQIWAAPRGVRDTSDYSERLVAQVVRLLGIQRENLKCDLGSGITIAGIILAPDLPRRRGDGFHLESVQVSGAHHHDWLGEAIIFFIPRSFVQMRGERSR